MSKYDLKQISKVVAEFSPLNKLQTPQAMYRAYLGAMVFAMKGLGLSRREIEDVFDDIKSFGADPKAVSKALDAFNVIDTTPSELPSGKKKKEKSPGVSASLKS